MLSTILLLRVSNLWRVFSKSSFRQHSTQCHSALYPSFRRKNRHRIFCKLPLDNFPHSAIRIRKIPLPSLKQCIPRYGNLISVNSLWTTLNWIPHFNGVLYLYLQWLNEWQFGLVIIAVVTSIKVTLRKPRLVLRVWDAWPFTGIQPRYVTNHLDDSASYPQWEGKYWSRDSGSALRWKCSRRSGFASAERHRICHISTYRLNGLRKGDEHPTYTPVRCITLYYFNFILSEAIHWKQISVPYISVNHSLKIDLSVRNFSEPFTENRILLLRFQWIHSLKTDSSAQSFSC